jgi:hypothetical protein
MAYKINELTALGRNLGATDELEVSLTGATGSRKITGKQITDAAGGGVHTVVKPLTGSYAYQSLVAQDPGSPYALPAANGINLAPYSPAVSFSINQMSVFVYSATTGEEVKLLIYSDVNGIPTTNLLTSTAISCGTTGFKTFSTSFTFNAGTKYWIGLISKTGGGATLNGLFKSSLPVIGFDGQGQSFASLSSSAYTYASPPATIISANLNFEFQPFFPSIGLKAV